MEQSDHDRMNAAREKRRRKLERYTNTPTAKARRLEMEKEFSEGIPMTFDTDKSIHEGIGD